MDENTEGERGQLRTATTKPERRILAPSSHRAGAGRADEDKPDGDAISSHEAAPPRHMLEPGAQVGRYQIVRLVGEGGMGAVYEAHDDRLNRQVALKVLYADLKIKRKAAKRFRIEAQAAARLLHPNVVGIYDFDVECDVPYMAMELLDGETLASAIARGPLALERIADTLLGVCAGVTAAHRAGIIHRDLKPSNIFLCRDWQGYEIARVLDFGISKVGGIGGSGVTQTGDIVGTSQYLSPEQASGSRRVTEASDQYSLGVVMYECATQRTPHQGKRMYAILRNIAQGNHIPVQTLRPDLPPEFSAIVERTMSARPSERFPSVYAMGQAVFPFASPEGKRRYEDFYCGSTDTGAQAQSPASPGRPVAGVAPATRPLDQEAAPPWRRQTTRTSRRRSRQRQTSEISASQTRLSPRMIQSVVLGVVLAAAALVLLALAVYR